MKRCYMKEEVVRVFGRLEDEMIEVGVIDVEDKSVTEFAESYGKFVSNVESDGYEIVYIDVYEVDELEDEEFGELLLKDKNGVQKKCLVVMSVRYKDYRFFI